MAGKDDLDLVGDWDALRPQKPDPKPARTSKAGVLDINELKAATQRAIQEGMAKKQAAEEAKVASILQKTAERARKEAALGKSVCRVLKLQYDKDFTFVGNGPSRDSKINLTGVAKLVFDKLREAQMQVDFERERSGGSYYDEDIWIRLKW